MNKKLRMQSQNIADKNYTVLSKLFPNAVTEYLAGYDAYGNPLIERAIDADVLRTEISCGVVEKDQERYQFTWPDKKKSIRMANTPIMATLRPCRKESVDFDHTGNLYLEGDNLDILKLLQETYLGKVKIIYIDPPYNTGNDFIYEDDFSETIEQYAQRSSQYHTGEDRLVKNIDTNGRFHTDWLNMMYSRLKLARNLLADDGVIFISIDDNEMENLRKICSEIFGPSNYVNHFAWITNLTGRQISGKGAAKTWESILVYAKDIQMISEFHINIEFAKRKMPDAYKGFKKEIRKDQIGDFAVGDTLYNHNRKFNEQTRPNLVFSIFYNPVTGELVPGDIGEKKEGFVELLPHANGDGTHKYHAWRWSRQKILKESYNLIVLPVAKGGYEIYTKKRDFNQTLLKDFIPNVSNGDAEVQKLFGGRKYFDYPKSVDLLKILLGAVEDREALVLDFFSGSATTAHAVMQLNQEDGGSRQYIMVRIADQIDQKSQAYQAGFSNICEIGKQRIRLAGEQIKAGDIGFRVLKLDSSNMKDIYYQPAQVQQRSLSEAIDHIKEDRTAEDLLFQVMLDLGIMLSSKIEEKIVNNKSVFYVAEGFLIACFDLDINEQTIKTMAQERPYYAVVQDSGRTDDQAAARFEEIFAIYSPDTIRKVL